MKKEFLLVIPMLSVFLLTAAFLCALTAKGNEAIINIAVAGTASGFQAKGEFERAEISKSDLYTFMFAQTGVEVAKKKPRVTEKNNAPEPFVPDELPSNIKELSVTAGKTSLYGVQINNETGYDLSDIPEYTAPQGTADGPLVLIVHTHTSESYRPSSAYNYTQSDNGRTTDINFSVAKVGTELAKSLSALGVNAISDTSVNDYPSYNGSYKKTMELISSYLAKYPTITTVIDLHRDAMEQEDGTKISTVCAVSGEKAAQAMLVVGTDYNGLSHDNWRQNLSFAIALQREADAKYPGLMRPINVRCERFNGHLSNGEILIEVGTTGNTMDEALVSARALADIIAAVTGDRK